MFHAVYTFKSVLRVVCSFKSVLHAVCSFSDNAQKHRNTRRQCRQLTVCLLKLEALPRTGFPFFRLTQERRENFLLQGRLSVPTLISVSVLPLLHVKDPGHSAKSAGGRLQLHTHTPYVCGFARSDVEHGCMVYTETAAVSCGTSHASA